MLSWEDGNPNTADEIGQTPVHVAAKCGKASSLRLLLSKGGRLDLKDDQGMTPMNLATDACTEAIMNHQITTAFGRKISKYIIRNIKGLRSR
jgi:ankyrin repeat protein